MMATSRGYSRPVTSPSLPSRAISTVKPASPRRALSVSRSACSSSTTRTRIPPSLVPRLTNRPARRVHVHRPDFARVVQQPEDVYGAATLVLRFGFHHARTEALLDHLHGLIHGY